MFGFLGVWVFELEIRVGVGEWNWRFENLMRKILIVPLTPDPLAISLLETTETSGRRGAPTLPRRDWANR